MADIDKLITIAENEIGNIESPANSNKQKYGVEYGYNGVPWCVIFVWWCFKHSGLSSYFYGGGKTASCTQLTSYHKAKNQVITSGYQKGDLILFNFKGTTSTDHIGICISYDGKTVTTIDGNTGTSNEANGGAVMKRTRTLSAKTKIICGIRWNNSSTNIIPQASNNVNIELNILKSGATGAQVKSIQILLNAKGYNCGAVDGDFGSKTLAAVKKYQTANKLTSDGIVGQNTWQKLLTE